VPKVIFKNKDPQSREHRASRIVALGPSLSRSCPQFFLPQMHRRNLDLRTANLEALDPNEIAGLRFDVLRTLVELGVAFDDANRVTNRMLRRNMNFNTARREELITRRQRLHDESLSLTREVANLQIAKAAATTEETSNRIDAEIAAKTALSAKVDKEVDLSIRHSDVRVTMRYVRAVEDTKRVAVEAIKLSARKNVQVLASWPKQPPVPAAVSH